MVDESLKPTRPEGPSRRSWRLRGLWAFLVHPFALSVVLLTVVAQTTGALEPLDRIVWRAILASRGPLSRSLAPTVLAVDSATLDRLGPPPWSPETWLTVTDALHRQHLDHVVLADPWTRLIAPGPAPTRVPAVSLSAPTITWNGQHTPTLPASVRGLVSMLPSRLDVPDLARVESVPVVSDGLPHLGCVAPARCPARGAIALPEVDIPVVSLSTLLDAPDGFLTIGSQGALLGLTAPPFSDGVRTAIHPASQPYVLVEAASLAAAHGEVFIQGLPPGPAAVWLLAIHLMVTSALLSRSWRRWIVLGPLVGATAALVAWDASMLEAPLLGGVLVGAAAPLGRAVAVSSTALSTVQRLGLLIVRASSRAGTLRRRISSADELLSVCADVTRGHAEGADVVLLTGSSRRRALRFHGGFGLTGADVPEETLKARHRAIRAAWDTWQPVTATGVLADHGREVLILPLVQAGHVVALWIIAPKNREPAPSSRRMAPIARWIGERLALPQVSGAPSRLADVMPADLDDEALDTMFVAADEERRRWVLAVRGLGHPVLVADTSGAVSLINPEMERRLDAAGLPRARSVREIVFRLGGESALRGRMASLFADGRPLVLPWPNRPNARLVIRPIGGGSSAMGDEPILGFLGWIEERYVSAFSVDDTGLIPEDLLDPGTDDETQKVDAS